MEDYWPFFPCEFESWIEVELTELYQTLKQHYGYDLLKEDGHHLITSNELAPVVLRVGDLFVSAKHFQTIMTLRKTVAKDENSALFKYHPYHWPNMIHAESMLAMLRQQCDVRQFNKHRIISKQSRGEYISLAI